MRCVLLAIVVLLAGLPALAQNLYSPWDFEKITPSESSYTCPHWPAFANTVDPGNYYIDSRNSVIDPAKKAAYDSATEALTRFSQSVALAADAWRSEGSSQAARCVYTLLSAAAQANAWTGKMPDYSGVYRQNWLLSAVAISYLKARGAHVSTPGQDAEIQGWFELLAQRVIDFFNAEANRIGKDKENNHRYWAGLSLTAEGIATDDLTAYRWGLGSYEIGVDNIQPDGSLTAEMNRGQRAMSYHLYALAPLVITAELAQANGTDLYSFDHGAIHRLVALCTAGLKDPGVFAKRTGMEQVVTLPYSGGDIGWAVPYVHRFPDPQLSALIAQAPWTRYTTWGGAPPDGKGYAR